MRIAEVVTVADSEASALRRITVVEVKLESGNKKYFAVSQVARGSGGYTERFRLEDSLIADWFGKWAKDPHIQSLKDQKVGDKYIFADIFPPTYQYLSACATDARKYHVEEPYWSKYDLSEVMAFAMTGC